MKATQLISVTTLTDTPNSARHWLQVLKPHRQPDQLRSTFELFVTLIPLAAIWVAMALTMSMSYWLALLLAVPAAGFLVRLFMIQHDCSHDAFFTGRAANAWTGRLIGIVTLTPFDLWRRTHAIHHAGSGNLGRRGIGDVDTLTVAEFRKRTMLGRLRYRLYRHPLILFGVGPTYLFLFQHRLPIGVRGREAWLSTMMTNLGIAIVAAGLMWLVGVGTFVAVHLPIAILASSIGVWLFYVQHQFEHTCWDEPADWDHPEAALHASSNYVLPPVLRWFTANIGVHHVHHLCSRIPFYHLPEVLRNHPELDEIGRLTLRQSFAGVRLVLWDQDARQLISFKEAANRRGAAPAPAGGALGHV
jgi:omega-6 fatty acid desaturase (delta-12 desaturase)